VPATRPVRIHVGNDAERAFLAQHASDRIVLVGQLFERAFHPPFGHRLAGVLASVEPNVERTLADLQAVDVLAIQALAERPITNAFKRGGLRHEVVMPLHRVRREICDPDDILWWRQLHGQHAAREAGVGNADPFLAVEAHHAFVVGPAIGIGRARTIGDAECDFAAGGAGETEVEPLIEIGHVVVHDLEIDRVAVLLDDADIAGVERARNGERHWTFLAEALLGRADSAAVRFRQTAPRSAFV
jgi:hypothetical protein